MSRSLRRELQQRKPFKSLEEEAFLNLARTDTLLSDAMDRLLAAHGVSAAQYNVLRILRGAGPAGLGRNEIRDRLIARMPDVTRLLDRMEDAGLVTRARDGDDRRSVQTRLTKQGRALVDSLDRPVAAEHRKRLGHLTAAELRALVALLTRVREGESE